MYVHVFARWSGFQMAELALGDASAAAGGDAARALPPTGDSTDAFEAVDDPANLYSTS